MNGKFVKLCDFGLSTFHEFEDQTHSSRAGSFKYIIGSFMALIYGSFILTFSIEVNLYGNVRRSEELDGRINSAYCVHSLQ